MSRANVVKALAFGVVGGLVSGLLGVGGGIVLVPALVLGLGVEQRTAHATSLAAIIPIGLVGGVIYALDDRGIHAGFAAALAAGAIVGAPLGVRALSRTPEWVLRLAFVAATLAAGVKLIV
ncbi:MAG TPA: TSUP family transporter [Actinomycetota bacterium]